jgi:AbrB family looped-hinge helix DNA binding protein
VGLDLDHCSPYLEVRRKEICMPSATVTSKGQITIPKEIRASLKLEAGDRVAFRFDGDGRVVFEPETLDLMSLYGSLKPRVTGITVDDMKEAIQARGAGR